MQHPEYYAERFGAVELDGLFYQVPAESTFQGWRRLADSKAARADPYELVPKANDYFTHKKVSQTGLEPAPLAPAEP